MSTKPGREGCVAYGPAYQVAQDKAAEVKVLLKEMEGDFMQDDIPCHIVSKGGPYNYNLTGQRNYAPRHTAGHNPRTQVIMHVHV
jgi:hypothetical protein